MHELDRFALGLKKKQFLNELRKIKDYVIEHQNDGGYAFTKGLDLMHKILIMD